MIQWSIFPQWSGCCLDWVRDKVRRWSVCHVPFRKTWRPWSLPPSPHLSLPRGWGRICCNLELGRLVCTTLCIQNVLYRSKASSWRQWRRCHHSGTQGLSLGYQSYSIRKGANLSALSSPYRVLNRYLKKESKFVGGKILKIKFLKTEIRLTLNK